MNFLKIIGIIIIAMACFGLLDVVKDYLSGKLAFWPFGVEIGAGLAIALGVFLIRRGNRNQNQLKL